MTARPPFRRVLVANRGEIAVRVCRGLRELGIEPVVVYSDADHNARHRHAGALAVPIGGERAADSYLRHDAILDAARATGAEAIHPGYGFLSENAAFARAVADQGLVFIGPDAEAMERLGSKQGARVVAKQASVPIVPGCDEALQGDRAWLAKAREIGFPLLIKASAGGGGKGMRVVDREADFLDALAAGRREAKAAFGDDRMLLEKRVFPARHVEIQIVGDADGEVVSFGERECSVQRRHQKVLEEAPSPAVDAELRRRMGEDAVRLARAAGYRNAGTVEFLLDEDGRYWFLEVNTRLQVEHPVTELVTGIDLVHVQVRVAAGELLRDILAGRDLAPRGHAIEARIYAEDPEHGFLPAAGRLAQVLEAEGPGVRVDSGVAAGDEVSQHYDPLLAKLVVHAPDRDTACRRLARALRDSVYLGIPTNVDFLRRVVEDDDFAAGRLRTDLLDLRPDLVSGPRRAPPDEAFVGAVLAPVLGLDRNGGSARAAGPSQPSSAWRELAGLRLWSGDP
jgi:3-methylcrotonyl-CoA carboxylase alpha subunit